MLRAPLDRFEHSWRGARMVHGELVAAWLRTDVDIVIAHGPFYTADETAAVLDPVPPVVPPAGCCSPGGGGRGSGARRRLTADG